MFLNGNPLSDLGNVKRVDIVMTNGRAYSFEELTVTETIR